MTSLRSPRPFWSALMLSLLMVLTLQWLAGTPASPVEQWLHIQKVPAWWPFALAAAAGLVGGALVQRQPPGADARPRGGGAPGAEDAPPKRGRYAVPRHVRREWERQRRRAEARARRAAAEADTPTAAGRTLPPSTGWLRRLGELFERRREG